MAYNQSTLYPLISIDMIYSTHMKTAMIEKYFLFILLAATIIFTLAIFYPFLTVVILAAAFAVVLHPLYLWIKKRITKGVRWIASLLTVIIFIIALCGPLFLIGKAVFNQTQTAYSSIAKTESTSSILTKIDTSINKIMPSGFRFDTHEKVTEIATYLTNNVTRFFASTFQTIILFILMILTLFYLLKDGDHWKKNFLLLCPLSEENAKEILDKLGAAINRILKGSFLIAIVQGILVSIGLAIFGVPNAAIWGVVAGIASFIPTLGTSIVSIPAILFLFFTGMEIQALGFLIWSAVLVGLVDNALTPYVISKNTEIPSLFILFSILGGISLLGPVGILIGPLALSLLYSLIAIYRKEVHI